MRVREVRISNGFKRFSDLTVGPLPESARLVVLLGSNGSGKSSFLEALLYWHRHSWGRHARRSPAEFYYRRPNQDTGPAVEVTMHGEGSWSQEQKKKAFHFRSAYRYTSDFNTNSIGRLAPLEESNPVDSLVEEDKSVAAHYNRLVGKGLAAYTNMQERIVNQDLYQQDVVPLASAVKRLFPDLSLTSLGNPTNDGTFLFTKGESKDFRYLNLSSGEKAAFDLLLDLYVRQAEYPESVICVDEPEAHIGLRVQKQVLDEMLRIVPAGCQLWVATHSAGIMRRAFEIATSNPESVVFLDFDDYDFDVACQMTPVVPDRSLWKKVHEIALEDLAALIAPETVYVCEGELTARGARRSFDANVLKTIFGDRFPTVEFVSGGGVTALPVLAESVTALSPGSVVRQVMDRDSRTDEAVADLRADPRVCVLSVRDLENYLLDDEILKLGSERYAGDSNAAFDAVRSVKESELAKQQYPDDVKAVAGQVFEEAKRNWDKLSQPGQDRHEFMRDVCAPLITPDTSTYERLSEDLRLA